VYTVNDSVSERHDVFACDRYLCLIYTYLCVREISSPGFVGAVAQGLMDPLAR